MVVAVHLYFDEMSAINSELFWGVKPDYMDKIQTPSQEWEYFERQKAGLQRWCQVAEARRVRSRVKKIVSCLCL